jgi:hypothetical protein
LLRASRPSRKRPGFRGPLNRLEAAGIIKRVRRLARRVVDFGSLVRLTTVQTTSLYSFSDPSGKTAADIVNVDNIHIDKSQERPTGTTIDAGLRRLRGWEFEKAKDENKKRRKERSQ